MMLHRTYTAWLDILGSLSHGPELDFHKRAFATAALKVGLVSFVTFGRLGQHLLRLPFMLQANALNSIMNKSLVSATQATTVLADSAE